MTGIPAADVHPADDLKATLKDQFPENTGQFGIRFQEWFDISRLV
jgi:hypothetical protein